MNNHENISEELLARYLAETASESEILQIKNWLAQSPANEQELAAYKTIWEYSRSLHKKKISVNTDAAWNKVKLKMYKTSLKADVKKPEILNSNPGTIQRKFPVALLAAAVVALLIMAYGFHLFKGGAFTPNNREIATAEVTTTSNTIEKVLPDGTKVFLNYNSTLTYPESFDGQVRSVYLKGEAFFEVKPDAARPFIIEANGTEVKVLGTSFNVKAYAREPVRVDVATGKVLVRKEKKEIYLIKGESAEVVADTVRSIMPDMNLMGYKTQIFDFNATDLEDVVTSIRNGYHIDLRLSNAKISQCRLTIRFEKEPVDATLSVIAETLDLKIRREGKTYWLDGSGCQ